MTKHYEINRHNVEMNDVILSMGNASLGINKNILCDGRMECEGTDI